jgi:hypothetical protein
LTGYLANESGPVSLVLDLHITQDKFGSSSDPNLNGHLHYPNDLDGSLNEAAGPKDTAPEFTESMLDMESVFEFELMDRWVPKDPEAV